MVSHPRATTRRAPKLKSSSTKDDPHHMVSPPHATTQKASKISSRHKKDILSKLITKMGTFREELREDIDHHRKTKIFGDTSMSI